MGRSCTHHSVVGTSPSHACLAVHQSAVGPRLRRLRIVVPAGDKRPLQRLEQLKLGHSRGQICRAHRLRRGRSRSASKHSQRRGCHQLTGAGHSSSVARAGFGTAAARFHTERRCVARLAAHSLVTRWRLPMPDLWRLRHDPCLRQRTQQLRVHLVPRPGHLHAVLAHGRGPQPDSRPCSRVDEVARPARKPLVKEQPAV
mmetsp:Transcript_11648/g.45318  ORF Transcript_11648/g.45318 Transcript_11648/m.45318 type:complete len:200 (+) Transcript_11648:2087-2686(+)